MSTLPALRPFLIIAPSLLLWSAASTAAGQADLDLPPAPSSVSSSSLLPDSPMPAGEDNAATVFALGAGDHVYRPAGPHDKYIEPGQTAPRLTAANKFVLGVKDATGVYSVGAWIFNAAYGQLTNNTPNYGTNSGAFAQRFGAASARDVSEEIFGDSILAPLLHEDPRYYRVGPSRNVVYRFFYASSRAIITRTDSGRHTVNFAQIGGNLGGAILTNTYYPPINQGFKQTTEIFAGSVGGSGIGFIVSEFLTPLFQRLHLSPTPQ